jgi:hypothetical protein
MIKWRMRWEGQVARMEKRNAYMILKEKPEGKRLRRRWEGNIKIDFRELRRGGMDWITFLRIGASG